MGTNGRHEIVIALWNCCINFADSPYFLEVQLSLEDPLVQLDPLDQGDPVETGRS